MSDADRAKTFEYRLSALERKSMELDRIREYAKAFKKNAQSKNPAVRAVSELGKELMQLFVEHEELGTKEIAQLFFSKLVEVNEGAWFKTFWPDTPPWNQTWKSLKTEKVTKS